MLVDLVLRPPGRICSLPQLVTSRNAWLLMNALKASSSLHSLVMRYDVPSATSFHSVELVCPGAAFNAATTPANLLSKSLSLPGITR
jgi:hypothetical protein